MSLSQSCQEFHIERKSTRRCVCLLSNQVEPMFTLSILCRSFKSQEKNHILCFIVSCFAAVMLFSFVNTSLRLYLQNKLLKSVTVSGKFDIWAKKTFRQIVTTKLSHKRSKMCCKSSDKFGKNHRLCVKSLLESHY